MQMLGTFADVPPARIQLALEKHNFDIPDVLEEICKEEEEKQRAGKTTP